MKKILFILLTLTLVALTSVSAFAEIRPDGEFYLNDSDVIIGQPGVYLIHGQTDTKHIIVDLDPSQAGSPVVLLLDNIYINVGDDISPIELNCGSTKLVPMGKCTVIRKSQGDNPGIPAIRVSESASLTIGDYEEDRSEELYVTSEDRDGVAIGGSPKDKTSGTMMFESGYVEARGGENAGAIGTSNTEGTTGGITVRGGTVKAYAGEYARAAAIGAPATGTLKGIDIEGGYVYAEAGEDGAAIGFGSSCVQEDECRIYISRGTIEAKAINGAGIGLGSDVRPKDVSLLVEIYSGSIKATSKYGAKIGGGRLIVEETMYSKGNSYSTGAAVSTSRESLEMVTVFGAIVDHDRDNNFTLERDGREYSYTYSGKGHDGDDNLYFFLPAGSTYTGSNDSRETFYSDSQSGYKFLRKEMPKEKYTFVLDRGDVTLTSSGASGYVRRDKEIEFVENVEGEQYNIEMTEHSPCQNSIEVVSGAHRVRLYSVCVQEEQTVHNCGFHMAPGTLVDLCLASDGVDSHYNDFSTQRPFVVPQDSYLKIEADENYPDASLLVANKGYTAAGLGGDMNGSSGVITINSGTVAAHSPNTAAIGGGIGGSGEVYINGGKVEAYGPIGGGPGGPGALGFVKITGGYVRASGQNTVGPAIGNGYNSTREGGLVEITGGTIDALASAASEQGIGGAGDGTKPVIYISGGSVDSYYRIIQNNVTTEREAIAKVYTLSDESAYRGIIPHAMAPTTSSIFGAGEGEDVTFNVTQGTSTESQYSYTGEGYSDKDDLYFYLPEGQGYKVTGSNGKVYTGYVTAADGGVFTLVPEPGMLALLALVALCFRRK